MPRRRCKLNPGGPQRYVDFILGQLPLHRIESDTCVVEDRTRTTQRLSFAVRELCTFATPRLLLAPSRQSTPEGAATQRSGTQYAA